MSPQAKRSSGLGPDAAIQRLNDALDQAEEALKTLRDQLSSNAPGTVRDLD